MKTYEPESCGGDINFHIEETKKRMKAEKVFSGYLLFNGTSIPLHHDSNTLDVVNIYLLKRQMQQGLRNFTS